MKYRRKRMYSLLFFVISFAGHLQPQMIFHVGVPSHLGPIINYGHITKINTIKNNHSYRTKNVELP